MIRTLSRDEKSESIPSRLSMPHLLLRLEGLTVLVAAVLAYAHQGFSGLAFGLLLLAPDISAAGYLVSQTAGARSYNLFHTYTLPAVLMALGLTTGWPIVLQLGLIWCAHIGMDRFAGYGLKYTTGFKDTHLGRI